MPAGRDDGRTIECYAGKNDDANCGGKACKIPTGPPSYRGPPQPDASEPCRFVAYAAKTRRRPSASISSAASAAVAVAATNTRTRTRMARAIMKLPHAHLLASWPLTHQVASERLGPARLLLTWMIQERSSHQDKIRRTSGDIKSRRLLARLSSDYAMSWRMPLTRFPTD